MPLEREPAPPWSLLRISAAWRGLEESLRELEGLLRQLDELGADASDALEAAEAIAGMLEDPRAAAGEPAGACQVRALLDKEKAAALSEEAETDLTQWLGDLARQVSDVPLMLEAPHASRYLGHGLLSDLPRAWQARLAPLALRLRQMLQAARMQRGGKRGTVMGAAAAVPVEPPRAPVARRFPPDVVVASGTDYAVVLPHGTTAEQVAAAHRELAFSVLQDLGVDAARLHVLLLATTAGESVSFPEVHRALGLDRRRGITRREKDERSLQAVRQLRAIRVVELRWQQEGDELVYERVSAPLWELKLLEYGQARLEERRGGLVARGEDWSLVPGSASWALGGPLGEVARVWQEHLDPRNTLAIPLALLLLFLDRYGEPDPLEVSNQTVLALAGLEPAPEEATAQRKLRQALRAAALAQAAWGWEGILGAGAQFSRMNGE